jgi:hypothetical protein
MGLRYIDQYSARIDVSQLFANPHPSVVDYLLELLRTKKLTRKFAIDHVATWCQNKNTDMIRFGKALNFTSEERREIIHKIPIIKFLDMNKDIVHALFYSDFREKLFNLKDTEEEYRGRIYSSSDDSYILICIIATLGHEDAEGSLRAIKLYRSGLDKGYGHDNLFWEGITKNSNDQVVDELIKDNGHEGLIFPWAVGENKNIRMFRFLRDHILQPNLVDYLEFVYGWEDEESNADCEAEIWRSIIRRRNEHPEIASMVENVLPNYQFIDLTMDPATFVKSAEQIPPETNANPFLTITTKSDWKELSRNPHLFDYNYDAMRKKTHGKNAILDKKNVPIAHISLGEAVQGHMLRPPLIPPRKKTETSPQYRRRFNKTIKLWNQRLKSNGHSPIIDDDDVEWQNDDAATTIQRFVRKTAKTHPRSGKTMKRKHSPKSSSQEPQTKSIKSA